MNWIDVEKADGRHLRVNLEQVATIVINDNATCTLTVVGAPGPIVVKGDSKAVQEWFSARGKRF